MKELELINEIQEILINTEEGSSARVLDEAINDVLDLISAFKEKVS